MTSEELEAITARVQNKRESDETSIALGLNQVDDLLSLARIGLADLDVCLMRQSAANPDDVIEAETKLEQLRIDYLARKDG